MTPLTASTALDAYFLEARSRLLDLAAFLDRIGRGNGSVQSDQRLAKIQKALIVLADPSPDRAERVQAG